MKYVKPIKLKLLVIMFFASGAAGIVLGLTYHTSYLTLLGVINLVMGGFMGYVLLTQQPSLRDKRKKKRSDNN